MLDLVTRQVNFIKLWVSTYSYIIECYYQEWLLHGTKYLANIYGFDLTFLFKTIHMITIWLDYLILNIIYITTEINPGGFGVFVL